MTNFQPRTRLAQALCGRETPRRQKDRTGRQRMRPWKRIRLAPETDLHLTATATAPDPAPAHLPDYAAELDALPPEEEDDLESEQFEIEYDSDEPSELSEPDPEISDPEPEAQQPLDLERLWALHFAYNGN